MSNASAEESSPTSSVSNDPFSPPRSNVEVTESGPFAGPWRRYLARSLDCTVGAGLTMYAAIAALGLVDVSKIDFDSRLVQQTVGMMAILISMAIDAAIYGVFKSTIGKALLRIRVVDATGARLSVAAYAKRNLRVWVSGFGLGIPLITLIAMLRQYGRLKARKPATYDEGLRTRVLGESVGVLRVASAIVLYLVVFSLITLQVGATDIVSAVRVLRSRGDAPPQAWRNAATGQETMIDGFWTYSVSKDEVGNDVFLFSEPLDQAAVVFSHEAAPEFSLVEYVDAFMDATAAEFRFDSNARKQPTFERNGRLAWIATGDMVESKGFRFELTVLQVDDQFWRTVKIQGKPTSATNEIANRLRDALWTTVE